MRIGLFGKILLAFWLVLFLMSQGLWLLYEHQRGAMSSEPRDTARVAESLLTLLAERIRESGPLAAQRDVQRLSSVFRERITISPASLPSGSLEPQTLGIARKAVAPDGREFLVAYVASGKSRGPLDIPSTILLVAAGAGLLFSAALAVYLSLPLARLRRGFHQLANGELDVRLEKVGRRRDEIGELARDFNVMAARLTQLLTARDRLLHDVSHELRSPLTRLQQAIGLARQDPRRTEDSLDRIDREACKLDSMVHELLALARAESGAEDGNDYFDPIAIAESVISDAEFEAQMRKCRISASLPALDEDQRPSVRGDAELVRRAIDNVVRNALRFSPIDGVVCVEVTLEQSPLLYRLLITDEGPGAAGNSIDKLFDPFVRADTRGTGLGLAIAKRAIVAHGGRIAARNREGGGFAVEIELPAATHANLS